MKKFTTNVLKFVSVAMLLGIATPIFAESAPVYDVDSMPQQFDNGVDQQDLPAPPAPEVSDTFVPTQPYQADVTAPLATSSPAVTNAPSGTIQQRLRRVEQQINNMQLSDRGAKLDSLQQQVQTLRGQVEQMMHDLQIMNSQQKKMYDDLDKRVQAISSAAETATPASTKAAKSALKSSDATPAAKMDSVAATETAAPEDDSPGLTPSSKTAKPVKPAAKAVPAPTTASADTNSQPNVAEEQQIYQTAYNYIKAKQYNEAVDALQGMLKKYPSGQFAANAHYWLGELYGLLNKHELAQKEFGTVIKTFPSSPRVSDAQLKVGLIFAAQSKWPDAKTAFKSVINHYPGTASARLASEQLKEIKIAGH